MHVAYDENELNCYYIKFRFIKGKKYECDNRSQKKCYGNR